LKSKELKKQNCLLQVKIRTSDSIRRYSFGSTPNWSTFIEHLAQHFLYIDHNNMKPDHIKSDVNLKLEYIDNENDTVTINCEEDWKEMILQKKNSTLVTLFLRSIELKHSSPNSQIELETQHSEEPNLSTPASRNFSFLVDRNDTEPVKDKEFKKEVKEKVEIEGVKEAELSSTSKNSAELLRKEIELRKTEAEKHNQNEELRKSAALHNKYVKQYAPQLKILYEAGFCDLKRDLYLLITFHGDLNTVIDRLLSQ